MGVGPNEDAWVLASLPRATAYARSLVGRSDADDVVHDCYARLLAKRGEYDLPADGTKLLFRAITRAAIDRHRRKRPTVSLDGNEGLPDTGIDEPADVAIGQEAAARLGEALAKLPMAQRAAIELTALGYDRAEIAESLEITANNAGVLLHRARATLMQSLCEK